MTTRKKTEQVDHNPFVKPQSQYVCAVPDCREHGVWSPMVNGSTWYCRRHANLADPVNRWQPKPEPYSPQQMAEARRRLQAFTGRDVLEPPSDDWWQHLIERWRAGEKLLLIQQVMARNAWINAGRPVDWMLPDLEAAAERAAIQAEGNA